MVASLGANEIQAEIIQLLFGEALTRKTKLQNGHTRCGIGDDEWRSRPLRQKGAIESARPPLSAQWRWQYSRCGWKYTFTTATPIE